MTTIRHIFTPKKDGARPKGRPLVSIVSKRPKKILPFVFITLLVLGGVFGPFGGVHEAAAGLFGIPNGNEILGSIGYFFLWIGSWILGAGGLILNASVNISIIDMKTMVKGIGAVETGWTTFRDIANIFFIFIILWIAFDTILQIGKYGVKQLLAKVIIVALLMNFSLFVTKVIIDASNIVAVSFYNAMNITVRPAKCGNPCTTTTPGGISSAFMQSFAFSTLYKTGTETPEGDGGRNLLIGVLGLAVMGIAAFIFFAAAGLLVIRFVVLVLLMVLSPLAFLAMILPGAKSWADKWWRTLFDQCLFAPIFMMLVWFVVTVITSPGFKSSIAGGTALDFKKAFGENVVGGVAGTITQVFLNFFVVTVFLVAALVIAKSMASSGGSAVTKAVDGTQKFMNRAAFGTVGFAGRNTLGRIGDNLASSDSRLGKRLQDYASKHPAIGGMLLKGAKRVGGGSFDVRETKSLGALAGAAGVGLGKVGGKGGARATREAQVKSREQYAKDLGKGTFVEFTPEQTAERTAYETALRDKGIAEQRKQAAEKQVARERRRGGATTPTTMAALAAANAEITRTNAEIKRVTDTVGVSRQEAYARTLVKSGTRYTPTGIWALMTHTRRSDREAAKKIGEPIEKQKNREELRRLRNRRGPLQRELTPLEEKIRLGTATADETRRAGELRTEQTTNEERINELELAREDSTSSILDRLAENRGGGGAAATPPPATP